MADYGSYTNYRSRNQPVPSRMDHSLYNEIRGCSACGLRDHCKGPVPGVGPSRAQVMLIGEAPGENEDSFGIPFTGATWLELQRYLGVADLSRDTVYLTNLVKCRPSGDPGLDDADICPDLWLDQEVAMVQPKLIVLMGQLAIRKLLGDNKLTVDATHGFPVWSDRFHCYLLPVYHPAAGFYDTRQIAHITEDFEEVGRAKLGHIKTRPVDEIGANTRYIDMVDNPDQMLRAQVELDIHNAPYLFLDTETRPDNSLWCLSASTKPGEATVWSPEDFRPIMEEYVESGGQIVFHSATFDMSKLRMAGYQVFPKKIYDTLVIARMLQKESASLKELSSRICGMTMTEYMEVVGPMQVPISLEYLHAALEIAKQSSYPNPPPTQVLEWKHTPEWSRRWKPYKPQPLWKKIDRLIKDLEEGKSDEPVQRWKKYSQEEIAGVVALLGQHPIAYLGHVDRHIAVNYSARDADATGRIFPELMAEVDRVGMRGIVEIEAEALPMLCEMVATGLQVDKEFMARLVEKIELLKEPLELNAWQKVGHVFNLASNDHVAKVLFNELMLPVGKRTEKKQAPSVDDSQLMPLKDRHPVISDILEWRSLDKVEDSYAVPLPLDADEFDRIHCDMSGMTVTGRVEAKDPNLMAIPIRNPVGREVRMGLIAGNGRSMMAADYSQVEMRVLAHIAQEQAMIELFKSDGDIHTYTANTMFRTEKATKDQRYAAKRVGFGIVFDITDIGLHAQLEEFNPGAFTQLQCQEMLDLYLKELFPKIGEYKSQWKAKLRQTGEIRDLYGRRRKEHSIWSSSRRIVQDAERIAINSPIQMSAQSIIKIAMARIWERLVRTGDIKYCLPQLQTHDDLQFEVDDHYMAEAMEWIPEEMVRDFDLSVPLKVSLKVGTRMGELEEVE